VRMEGNLANLNRNTRALRQNGKLKVREKGKPDGTIVHGFRRKVSATERHPREGIYLVPPHKEEQIYSLGRGVLLGVS